MPPPSSCAELGFFWSSRSQNGLLFVASLLPPAGVPRPAPLKSCTAAVGEEGDSLVEAASTVLPWAAVPVLPWAAVPPACFSQYPGGNPAGVETTALRREALRRIGFVWVGSPGAPRGEAMRCGCQLLRAWGHFLTPRFGSCVGADGAASGEEFFGEARQWRVEWQGKVMGSAETLSTEEVGDARQCRAAIDRGERAVLQRVRDAEQQREKRRAEERSTEESVRPPRTSTYSTAITACYASITTVSFFVIFDLTRTTRL